MGTAVKQQPRVRNIATTVTHGDPSKPVMTARDLLNSGLVGIWKDRKDIGESRAFAAELRKRVQN